MLPILKTRYKKAGGVGVIRQGPNYDHIMLQ